MKKQQGVSLVELLIVMVVAAIILGPAISFYVHYTNVHLRQQYIVEVERELGSIQSKIEESLTSMPGRDLAYFTGKQFSIASLPSNGTVTINSKQEPINLGVVTPFKINGNDAITVAYGRRGSPRLVLTEPTREDWVTLRKREYLGIARVVVPDSINPDDLVVDNGSLMALVGSAPLTPGSDGSDGGASVARLVKL
jgi:prepilin-type N-terminal cleavage/methylation domain-containing protein